MYNKIDALPKWKCLTHSELKDKPKKFLQQHQGFSPRWLAS
jgi:hypothetical protein